MQKFSFDTIKNFDNHINGSIQGYSLLYELMIRLSEFFITRNSKSAIADLGCTSGRFINKLKECYPEIDCIGYDITDHNFIADGKATLLKKDLTDERFSLPKTQLVFSVFTLQFIPIEKRMKLLREIYDSLISNGAFFFCEKEYTNNAKLQEAFTFSNYDYKSKQFTPEEILQKERDIRKLMSPLDGETNIKMLRRSGFSKVELFFKSMNFSGYICIK